MINVLLPKTGLLGVFLRALSSWGSYDLFNFLRKDGRNRVKGQAVASGGGARKDRNLGGVRPPDFTWGGVEPNPKAAAAPYPQIRPHLKPPNFEDSFVD